MTTDEINAFMGEAIMEGRNALPTCLPNPPVGCVIVKDGKIISRGHTNNPGKAHAEIMALQNLPPDADAYAMFVTLEPCSFIGRTPSCAQTILRSEASAIYIGIIDPDRRNSGKGVEILKKSPTLAIHVGICRDKIHQELEPYLFKE